MLSQGRPFQSASLDMVRNNKEFATTHADCLAKKRSAPAHAPGHQRASSWAR